MAKRADFLCTCILVFLGLIFIEPSDGAVCDVAGKFGWECRFTCNCADNEPCDLETGHCKNGCKQGFYGTGCQFDDGFIYGDETGKAYTGKYGTPTDKLRCVSWGDSRIQHYNKYTPIYFHDGVMPGPYCRNPKDPQTLAYSVKPWCYVESAGVLTFKTCEGLQVKDCPDYLFGDFCEHECHCADKHEVCDKNMGFCSVSKKCYAGWTGTSCKMACPSNMFGIDCKYTCGECLYGICDHETGRCLKGCKAGYYGQFCSRRCGNNTYGANCMQTCGQCRIQDCHPETGVCEEGCEPGYTGATCHRRCPNGQYGLKCEGRCPYCHNKGPCHPVTGVCEAGCTPGFMGQSCNEECMNGYFGANCTRKCGFCRDGRPCDKFTGQCLHGCETGYAGVKCLAAATQEDKPASAMGGVLGGAIAGIIVVVIIVIVLLFIRRRRFHQKLVVSKHLDRKKPPTTDTTLENIRETDLLLKSSEATVEVEDHEEEDCVDMVYDKTHSPEPIYMNVNNTKLSNPIPVDKLRDWIQKAKDGDSQTLRLEHANLPTGLLALCHTALKPENKPKNRYADIIAYDHSRVMLTPLLHDPHSDYVNANYLDGYNSPKAYIASQGPNKAMLSDFWRMVWQEKVTKIVMLTNLVETCKKKCEQYWPSEGHQQYGDVTVEVLDTAEYTDYVVRTFTISVSKISRIIKQFHFLSWTDHGAPTYPTTLLNFRRKVQQYNPDSNAPILVHCSAGIGRSGTYMAVDYLLHQAKAEGMVDLLQCAQLMRSNRVNMIQTWQQYSFVYDAVLDALMSGETTLVNSTFPEMYEEMCTLKPDTNSTLLEDQYETLQSLTPVLDRDECKTANDPKNASKSRFRNILPGDRYRPHLFTPVDDCNDFINAVFLPSYTQRDAYIVTQMPLPNTVADFWRLLYDYHSDTVVMLNEFDRNDKSCALYWPEEYGYTVEYGPLSIELLFSSEADTNITVRTFKLTNRLKGEDRAVKQFQFNGWPDYKSVPNGTSGLLRLTDAVQEWTRQNGKGPITVHCMNGSSKSGLFCACSLMFERMRIDMEVDIYQTVKQIRISRPHFVENMEQYQYCYQMALAYLERQPVGIDRQADRQTNDSIDSGIQDKLL